jgi:hypothetical protein
MLGTTEHSVLDGNQSAAEASKQKQTQKQKQDLAVQKESIISPFASLYRTL